MRRCEWEHTVPDGKGEAMTRDWTQRRGIWQAAAALAMVLAVLAAAACSRTSPEQRLREQIGRMQAALEQRQPRVFIDGVAEDFAGNGGMDRAALQQAVRAQVLAHADVGLTLGPAEIELQGDRATVRFSALATGGSGRLLPERAGGWHITSGWRDEDGQWLLYYAEWRPL